MVRSALSALHIDSLNPWAPPRYLPDEQERVILPARHPARDTRRTESEGANGNAEVFLSEELIV